MVTGEAEEFKDGIELSVSQRSKNEKIWHHMHHNDLPHETFHDKLLKEPHLISSSSDVGIIFAKADQVRDCGWCRNYFSSTFQIPPQWWSGYYRNSNGYFGTKTLTDEEGNITAYSTWARFLIKFLKENNEHEWYKLNIFTLWSLLSNQTTIIVFDAPHSLKASIPSPIFENLDSAHLRDPFWMYPLFAEEIACLQDKAVWIIRTHVRNMEKTAPQQGNPNPDYRRLHDIARHAVHVSETLDLAVKSMTSILTHHADFMAEMVPSQDSKERRVSRGIRQHILSSEHLLESLRYRSTSNKERLSNEIQLTFNNVAEHNSGTLVNISSAAQIEGKAMKTVAFITLIFLPSTFVSAIFSMSFFNYNPDSGTWAISDRFWMFWVFAALATFLTFVAYRWANISFVSTSTEKIMKLRRLAEKVRESSSIA